MTNKHHPQTNITMNTTHELPAQAKSIYESPSARNSITHTQTERDGMDSIFSIVDSAELKLFPLMSPAETGDAAILYVEKGEVTLRHDRKTYLLSKGMLLYKVPKMTVQLLNFSEDCHFKVICFSPQFAMNGSMPVTHLQKVTAIASNNPVFTLDTLTAASITVLFWLLQKKVGWEESAQSPDETIQHVFSLLMLEIVSAYKRKHSR